MDEAGLEGVPGVPLPIRIAVGSLQGRLPPAGRATAEVQGKRSVNAGGRGRGCRQCSCYSQRSPTPGNFVRASMRSYSGRITAGKCISLQERMLARTMLRGFRLALAGFLVAQVFLVGAVIIDDAGGRQFDNARGQRGNEFPVMADEDQGARVVVECKVE